MALRLHKTLGEISQMTCTELTYWLAFIGDGQPEKKKDSVAEQIHKAFR